MSTERPILFNGAMVRAILAGQKTQTRRVLKMPHGYWETSAGGLVPIPAGCPFGQPGDRLWVRESFADLLGTSIEHRPNLDGPIQRYAYSADTLPGSPGDYARKDYGIKWRPSIHMPRAACRLVLEITAVRVERLQAISEADAMAEGINCYPFYPAEGFPLCDGYTHLPDDGKCVLQPTAREAFRDLWASTGGDWDSNPWVWVIELKRVTP